MLPYLYLSISTVALAYISLQLFNVWAWHKSFKKNGLIEPKSPQTLALIIPFRNESLRLTPLLNSLKNIEESIEILFVDDHSSDNSKTLLESAGHLVVSNLGEGKKAALTRGIQLAKSTYILTLDADCHFESGFIKHKMAQTATNADMITGLICVTCDSNTLLSSTQKYLSNAFQSLQAFGAVTKSHFMASGANLLFKKEVFLELNGYEGNEHLSSGDDVFLLQKFQERQKTIETDLAFIGTVFTHAEPTWRSYMAQQSRWASKNSSATSTFQRILYVSTALFHISFMTSWLWSIEAFVILFLIKGLSEFPIISTLQAHFNQRISLLHYPLIWLISPFILTSAHFSKYWQTLQWKDREITY